MAFGNINIMTNAPSGWSPDRVRRLIATALLYVGFGLGAVAVALLVVLPVAALAPRRQRARRVRAINRLAFAAFTRCGVAVGIFAVSFIDAQRLKYPGQLIIANHPSLLDVVFLLGSIPHANCVIKKALLKNPFLALQVYFADYIPNSSGEEFIDACVASIERGESLIIFPQGTRNASPGDGFRRGAAYVMLRANCRVRPVHIACAPPAFGRQDPWYAIPARKITYRFTALDEFDLTACRSCANLAPPLKARRLTKWLSGWYTTMDGALRDGGAITAAASVVADGKIVVPSMSSAVFSAKIAAVNFAVAAQNTKHP